MRKSNNNNTADEPKLLWLKHFSAGICAGGTSRTCTAPIDRLRTFFQGTQLFLSLSLFCFFKFYCSLWS